MPTTKKTTTRRRARRDSGYRFEIGFARMGTKINRILKLCEGFMSKFDDIKAANARTHAAIGGIGTSLTGVAADIRALKDGIKPGMTETEAAELATDAEAAAVAAETAAAAVAALDAENPEPAA